MSDDNKNHIAPKTLSRMVQDAIREDILSGKFPPGARIDQNQLAAQLGVSLIPVREGLRQLEAEGLVRVEPRRGVFVAERSADEVREISLIRERLEELATQLAVPKLTDADFVKLDGCMQQMARAITLDDLPQFLALNREFHFIIYSASQQDLLVQMIASLWDRFRLYRQRAAYITENAQRSYDEHQEILAALRARDVLTVGALMREHVRRSAATIANRIDAAKQKLAIRD